MHSLSALSRKLRSQLSSYQFAQAGFTMIELLIVIAILGILAVAVLSAINPIEQINRGRDTSSQSDAEQLLTAIDRYVAFQGYLPWQTEPDTATRQLDWIEFDSTVIENGGTCPVYEKLGEAITPGCTGAGELKVTFFNRILPANNPSANPLFLFRGDGVSDSVYACFAPQSQAFLTQAITRCNNGLPSDLTSESATICPAATEDSLFCIP